MKVFNERFKHYINKLTEADPGEIDKNADLDLGSEEDGTVVDVDDVEEDDDLDEEDFDLSGDEDEGDQYSNESEFIEKRDELITNFNEINKDSYITLEVYQPDENFVRSIKPKLVITDKMVYLDWEKYNSGVAELALNEVFYNDVKSIAAKLGVEVEWRSADEGEYGVISLID